jgi:hypothetical protein
MRFIKTCIFVICILVAILFFITGIVVALGQKNIPAFIFFYVIGAIILWIGIIMHRKTDKEKEIISKKQIEKKDKLNDKFEKYKLIPGSIVRTKELNSKTCIQAKHISGLPVAQEAPTYLYLCEDKIIFERNEMTYNLEFNKIKDITIKTDMEIQKAYVSSAGGAVAGGILFGPLGAIIGGRTKTKTNKTINKYLIFTYNKDNNIDFISFDVTGTIKAYDFVKFFMKNIPSERTEVNL